MLLYGYTRVSTLKQISQHSLDVQADAIKKYCKAHDHELKHIYTDKGVSAYKNRPKFEIMMKKAFEGEVDGVIVHDLTRFGRDTRELLEFIHRLNDKKKTFISIKDNIDISTKTGKLMLTLLSGLADYERAVIAERLEAGKEWAKIHGTKSGKPMHRPKKEIDWDKFDELYKLKMPISRIATHLGVTKTTLYNRMKERKQ